MACRCAERRAAMVGVMKRPTTVLTAAKFVAKTGVQDVASFTAQGSKRIQDYLQRRGMRS